MKAAAPLVLGALLAGAAVRLLGGLPLAGTDLRFDSPATALPPAAGSPEAAAAAFYSDIEQGKYDAAWEISAEPAWPGAVMAGYGTAVTAGGRPAGWTGRAEFVRRCRDELGAGLKLNGIAAVRLPAPPGAPEEKAASDLMPARLYGVRASGQMLGACLIYSWVKDLAVVEAGGRYRVLLPGTKPEGSTFHETWFSDVSLVGSLRSAGK